MFKRSDGSVRVLTAFVGCENIGMFGIAGEAAEQIGGASII
jgi:hypothetical protein